MKNIATPYMLSFRAYLTWPSGSGATVALYTPIPEERRRFLNPAADTYDPQPPLPSSHSDS